MEFVKEISSKFNAGNYEVPIIEFRMRMLNRKAYKALNTKKKVALIGWMREQRKRIQELENEIFQSLNKKHAKV